MGHIPPPSHRVGYAKDQLPPCFVTIGEPYWGRRLGSAAATAAVEYGFKTLGLRKICASVLPSNDASARICLGLGMRREGRLRQHLEKWGEVHDLDLNGLLRDEWRCGQRADAA